MGSGNTKVKSTVSIDYFLTHSRGTQILIERSALSNFLNFRTLHAEFDRLKTATAENTIDTRLKV